MLRHLVAALLLALGSTHAQAIGLGEIQLTSRLGERLHARIPLVGSGAADLAPGCVRVVPDSALQDAPPLAGARTAVDRTAAAVVITTAAPVNEPAVRFVVEVGCTERLRREFVLLIDPPELPMLADTAGPESVAAQDRTVPTDEPRWQSATAQTEQPVQSSVAMPAPAAAPVAERAAPAPTRAQAKPKRVVTVHAKAKPATPAADSRPAPAPAATAKEAAPRPAQGDRLVLADAEPTPESAQAPINTPAPAADEALRKQIEALTREVGQMRNDMAALSARNRQLEKDAPTFSSGWLAAGGLAIVMLGIGIGSFGAPAVTAWRARRSAYALTDEPDDVPFEPKAAKPAAMPATPVAPAAVAAAAGSAEIPVTRPKANPFGLSFPSELPTDLDVTKILVDEEEERHTRGLLREETVTSLDTGNRVATVLPPAGADFRPAQEAANNLHAEFDVTAFNTKAAADQEPPAASKDLASLDFQEFPGTTAPAVDAHLPPLTFSTTLFPQDVVKPSSTVTEIFEETTSSGIGTADTEPAPRNRKPKVA